MFLLTHVGLLGVFCKCLLESLDRLPGDARTMVGVLTYDSSLHFYNLNVSGSLYVDLVYNIIHKYMCYLQACPCNNDVFPFSL